MAKIEHIVALALVIDLMAFTIPLPLFPRLIQWFTRREGSNPDGFLSQTLHVVSAARGLLYKPSRHSERWDVVLLGGLMGSLFSALQFIVSPWIGALSDRYGRRRVLLATMVGNILSALVWIKSTTFLTYILSRVIGGLSEGNVQISIAILSDVTTPDNRSRALAFVGIAFSICFCIGPPIGAWFASQPIPQAFTASGMELNVYAVPAAITLGLLLVETAFLALVLPETRGKGLAVKETASKEAVSKSTPPKKSPEERISMLKVLQRTHFLYLALFSGMEFTLTFLTFDLFDWTNKQNGMLLAFIGVISALLQGGYTRRAMGKVGEGAMARRGVLSCALGLMFLALIPHFEMANAVRCLQAGAVFLAYTSATVVTSLTSYASLQCDEGVFDEITGKPLEGANPQLAKGRALGQFRSSGQLGRAIGPLLACASYWTFGPSVTYSAGAIGMLVLSVSMKSLAVKRALSS